MIPKTSPVKNLLNQYDLASLKNFGLDFFKRSGREHSSFIASTSRNSKLSGGSSDSIDFLISYRIYGTFYTYFKEHCPKIEFEHSLMYIKANAEYEIYQTLNRERFNKTENEIFGAFVLSDRGFIIKLKSESEAVNSGDGFFISQSDLTFPNLSLQSLQQDTTIVFVVVWIPKTPDQPWFL